LRTVLIDLLWLTGWLLWRCHHDHVISSSSHHHHHHHIIIITEWHPWDGEKLQADWSTMTGRELYDYRAVDMTDFNQFDRVNVAAEPKNAAVAKQMSAVLHAHFNNM
jgi:hypothetical protein